MASTNDQLNNLDRNRVTQQAYIAKLEAHIERLTNERRSHNLIIEGLSEDTNEDVRTIY